MRRQLAQAGAWTLATGAAVAMCWYGVHTVLQATLYDPPPTLPLTAGRTPDAVASPSPGATRQGALDTAPPDAPPDTEGRSGTPRPDGPPAATGRPDAPDRPSGSPSKPAPGGGGGPDGGTDGEAGGDVRGYSVAGGHVTLELHEEDAEFLSATPGTGWRMQVWEEREWIRVTFTGPGDASSSVFCTWNGHPPRVETYEEP